MDKLEEKELENKFHKLTRTYDEILTKIRFGRGNEYDVVFKNAIWEELNSEKYKRFRVEES